MSYSTATPAQQAQVNNFVQMLRSTIIRLWQVNNNTSALVTAWNANILGILGSPQGIAIPDGTGLAGAVVLTDTQVTNLFGILQTLQSTNMTQANENAFMLATGPSNSTGT
jgi:hypothetical protein